MIPGLHAKLISLSFKKKRPWWQWFYPSAFRERKYLWTIERVMNEELKKHRAEFDQHLVNVIGLGYCFSECGYKLIHGIPEDKENGRV